MNALVKRWWPVGLAVPVAAFVVYALVHTGQRWLAERNLDPRQAQGNALFREHCVSCHGAAGRGKLGVPDLSDADWLWGGGMEDIRQSIAKGRVGEMPPMAAAVGTEEDNRNVANYVLSLSGNPHDSQRAALGAAKFGVCVVCHGDAGQGNPAVGGANLTDRAWLHGYGESAIMALLYEGRSNVMPGYEGKLTSAQIELLVAYVWSLSHPGGQP